MLKVMFSVGEASGDLHGASVAGALKQLLPSIKMFGMGGQNMAAAGVEINYDIADLGVIGVVEVIRNLPRLFKLRDDLAVLMDEVRPDVLVIIDYPEFNTQLAKQAKARNIPIVSYISPSAWAWRKGRARQTAELVTKVAAIFPFEAEVYQKAGADVVFVGHPLLDIVQPTLSREQAGVLFGADLDQPVVLLLPGSRRQEIVSLLPVMLDAAELIAKRLPTCQFFLPVASTIPESMLTDALAGRNVKVNLARGNTYDLMQVATAAIAASGTVTLEAAILGLPSIIVYRVNRLTYYLGKLLVKIPHIGLPNIVAGRKVVPELLQDAVTPNAIAAAVVPFLTEPKELEAVKADLAMVRKKLGQGGAVNRVAQLILAVAGQKEEAGQ